MPELTEEEAMRLLEQGEIDTSETPPVPPPHSGGGENDAEMDADTAAADKVSGGGSAGTGPGTPPAATARQAGRRKEGAYHLVNPQCLSARALTLLVVLALAAPLVSCRHFIIQL